MTTTHSEPHIPGATSHILRVFREATDDQLRRGIEWYSNAHAFARALDPDDVWRAAGVIAALSPRLTWEGNMILAARVYSEGHASGTLTDGCRKADKIYGGEPALDVLRGPKTRAFCETIAEPERTRSVVVDRHALSIALGRSATEQDQKAYLGHKGGYDAVATAYRRAAGILGMPASQVQAVTWNVWRENCARNHKANRRKVTV